MVTITSPPAAASPRRIASPFPLPPSSMTATPSAFSRAGDPSVLWPSTTITSSQQGKHGRGEVDDRVAFVSRGDDDCRTHRHKISRTGPETEDHGVTPRQFLICGA